MAHLGLFKQIMLETDNGRKKSLCFVRKSPQSDTAPPTFSAPAAVQRRQVAYPAVK